MLQSSKDPLLLNREDHPVGCGSLNDVTPTAITVDLSTSSLVVDPSIDSKVVEARRGKIELIDSHLRAIENLVANYPADQRVVAGLTEIETLKSEISAGKYDDVIITPEEDDPIVIKLCSDESALRGAIQYALAVLHKHDSVSKEMTNYGKDSLLAVLSEGLNHSLKPEQEINGKVWRNILDVFGSLYSHGIVGEGCLNDLRGAIGWQFGPFFSPRAATGIATVVASTTILAGVVTHFASALYQNKTPITLLSCIAIGAVLTTFFGISKVISYSRDRDLVPMELRSLYGKVCALKYCLDNGTLPPYKAVIDKFSANERKGLEKSISVLFGMKILEEREEYIREKLSVSRKKLFQKGYPNMEHSWEEMKRDESVANDDHMNALLAALFSVKAVRGMKANLSVLRELREVVNDYCRSLSE